MNKIILVFGLLLLTTAPVVAQMNSGSTGEETTLIFVRHAEKLDDGTGDPSLNKAGEKRAVNLAKLLLKNYDISAIYSTPYKRTRETATPLADSLGISVQPYGLKDPQNFIRQLIEKHQGKVVLITGHSNTTPLLVNIALGSEKYAKLDESDYDKIFIVMITAEGTISEQVISYQGSE